MTTMTNTPVRSIEELAERAENVLTRIARGSQYHTITYGVLAALITEPDEPLVDHRLTGRILDQVHDRHTADEWQRYLVACAVNAETGEVSEGYDRMPLPAPTEARRLAHEGARNPNFIRG